MKHPVTAYGLIGCGGFGRFCLGEYQKMESLHCVAVADHDLALAKATAEQFGVQACASAEALLARPDIQIVHLATPPSTHAALATAALEAGKHVLCEKPLALTLEDAAAMVALAKARERVLAVNLIMRYNPLCAGVKQLAEQRLLGEPLYATLTNAAQDEVLVPGHWFWDREQSGGIFIEHGVHFFDLFEWWFGEGKLLSAVELQRPGTNITDQVQCSIRYGELTLGSFYHGFHQMRRRDEQQWRIVFETGTLAMSEWVPTSLEIDMHGSEAAADQVRGLFPDGGLEIVARYGANERLAMSRHRPREVEVHARIKASAGYPKMELYGVMLRSLMEDQLRAIHSPGSPRLVSEQNGLSSLAYAVAAHEMAAAADP